MICPEAAYLCHKQPKRTIVALANKKYLMLLFNVPLSVRQHKIKGHRREKGVLEQATHPPTLSCQLKFDWQQWEGGKSEH